VQRAPWWRRAPMSAPQSARRSLPELPSAPPWVESSHATSVAGWERPSAPVSDEASRIAAVQALPPGSAGLSKAQSRSRLVRHWTGASEQCLGREWEDVLAGAWRRGVSEPAVRWKARRSAPDLVRSSVGTVRAAQRRRCGRAAASHEERASLAPGGAGRFWSCVVAAQPVAAGFGRPAERFAAS